MQRPVIMRTIFYVWSGFDALTAFSIIKQQNKLKICRKCIKKTGAKNFCIKGSQKLQKKSLNNDKAKIFLLCYNNNNAFEKGVPRIYMRQEQ